VYLSWWPLRGGVLYLIPLVFKEDSAPQAVGMESGGAAAATGRLLKWLLITGSEPTKSRWLHGGVVAP